LVAGIPTEEVVKLIEMKGRREGKIKGKRKRRKKRGNKERRCGFTG
jgi:hypothetical protein